MTFGRYSGCDVDWQDNMLSFMKAIGEESNEWYPELWQSYGISEKDAKIILDEYQKKYPEDS